NSFDPAYDALPLSHFAARVEEVFARTPYDRHVIQSGQRKPLFAA
ncbi:MAG: putative HD phosphohydrolase, partial [Yoonia sp.]